MTSEAALDLMSALVLEDGRLWGDVACEWQWDLADNFFSPEGRLWSYCTRPRGAGKTTDLSGLSLVWLATEAAPGARGFTFAGSREQASLLLDFAAGLVDRTPELSAVIDVQANKLIARNGATIEVRSADGGTAMGIKPSLAIVDEVSAWEEGRRAQRLWTAVMSSLNKVPGCRFVCLSNAGEPSHWSYKKLQAAREAPDRWFVSEVIGPLPWVNEADLKAQGLRDSEYSRLHLNLWQNSEDRLVTAEDLAAAAVLDGEQEPRPGVQYLISCDIGLVRDATVVAVGHSEETSPEPGAPKRVVIDSIRRWRGKRLHPVQISDIEGYLALTAARYNRAKILADPWQAAGMIQRLQAQGIRCEQWPFTTTSTGRLGQSLHLALKNGLIWLPRDDDLLDELGRVRLKENGVGQARLDHDADSHDDQAVAIGILTAELIGNVQNSIARQWMESIAPIHSCGQPNLREALVCSKCHESLTPLELEQPYVPEPVAAQPWSPWTPIPERQASPGQAQFLDFLQQQDPKNQNHWSNWAFRERRS